MNRKHFDKTVKDFRTKLEYHEYLKNGFTGRYLRNVKSLIL